MLLPRLQWNHTSSHLPNTPKSFASSTLAPPTLPSSISEALSFLRSPRHLPQIHSFCITSGLARSPFFAGKLIAAYSDLRNPAASLSVFLSTPRSKHNVFLWNSIIRARARNGMFAEALDCYEDMRKTKLRPDAFTLPSVISACAGLGDLRISREVHQHVVELGLMSDLYIGNALIGMYSRVGSLVDARDVFDGMARRDIVSWNSLISGYSANGEWEKAVEVYGAIRMDGFVPDCFTVESVLPAFGGLGAIQEGQMVHGLVYKVGIEEDRLVGNGLIAMYCRFENLVDARRVFDMLVGRDVVSWNTIIDGYYQVGDFKDALQMFRKMMTGSKPDLVTLTVILHACCEMGDLQLGCSVHGYIMRNGYECDITALNILLAMYGKCGSLIMVRNLFDQMDVRDSFTWNSLINSYVRRGLFSKGIELFKSMKQFDVQPDFVTIVRLLSMCTELQQPVHGRGLHCNAIKRGLDSNLFVGNALLDMYSKCGSLEDALEEFQRMEVHDRVSWNTIISGCVHSGNCSLGFELISEMKVQGQRLDKATILGILPACSYVAAKRLGKEIHGCILKLNLECDAAICNALIEMYSKCGRLDHAVCVFEHMNIKDIVTWTSLIFAYGMYGQGDKALRVFMRMEKMGVMPDHVAFLAIIYACSHSGLVDEGKMYFKRMEQEYKIIPSLEHYACMVDLLGRSGKLEEAEIFIEAMPVQPDISIWGALLSACRIFNETLIAERVCERIMAFDTENTGCHVLASNLYAAIGKWDMVVKIRKSMEAKTMKKDPGFSWIEVKNKVYVFGTGEQLVEQSEEVYKFLEVLTGLMAKEGYVPDRKFVLQDVEEDDKKHMLCTHSERLAIAFGLLNTKPGTPLLIMKNLRACGDCHTAIKYITKIVAREILIRDSNRFHLFKDGFCSCGDFW
ncbi:pentatricopeptide repeat-containing protein At3g03580-like [Musa acuminata AAA Group]|uniref:pentatricopeptide repeat-containing protein At3g03580-like n=1 Tax=Musa acuminata AAA Group TaxID=214697 RepID=UPI0031E2BF5D